jgi:D-glycero-D-manno-heptose 1,7-bisphosphate phosphatase
VGIGPVSRPAVFLDRDGVLVEEIYYPHTGEWEAPLGPQDVRLIPGAAGAAKRLAAAGFALVVISNQGAHAKGKTSLRALWLAHERFIALMAAEGVQFDRVFYSYSHPDGIAPHFSGPSLERKPGPYNLFIATAELDLDLARSWMVGDRTTDIACAEAAGVRGLLIENQHAGPRNVQARDLAEAAGYILNHSDRSGTAALAHSVPPHIGT